MAKIHWYVQIPLLFLFFCHVVSSQLPPSQITTMNRIYELLKNNNNTGWNITKDSNPCSWKGVICNSNISSITHLSLSSISLSTSDFLPVLCEIGTLESLDLSMNKINSIPDGFVSACSNISGLKLLNFSLNRLSGSLPNFQGFGALEHLDFSHNNLNGSVDSQLGGLVNLKSLNLSSNKFSGSVPKTLENSTLLEELLLSNNAFDGQIPQSFGGLSKLSTLILSANNLTGEIPQFLTTITTLSRFAANQNKFEGVLPRGITRFLKNIDLSYNKLSGSMPLDLLSPSNLEFVDLSFNSLDGSIPENISQRLFRLRLGNNSLNGTIPVFIGNLKNLTYLELDSNRLMGSIPPELGSCSKLALLNLAENQLTGILPRELGDLSNLQVMRLQRNNFSGEIPLQISNLNRLQIMNISWNSLNGSIPSSFSNLTGLTNLDLSANNLDGSLPYSLGSLANLIELQLANNKLTGEILSVPRNLQISFNLSHNLFKGNIPRILSSITGLEVLDLSNNQFSGVIPDSLTTMGSLTHLILSNNSLSGLVPIFKPFVMVETSGNHDLVYPPPSNTPPLAVQKHKRNVAVMVLIAAATGVVTVGIVAVLAFIFSRRFYKVNDEHVEMEEVGPTRPEIIDGVLLTGNGIHRSNIDFTVAMEAVTRNSNMFLKTRFSTYFKAVMPSGMRYIVKKINWTDKIFQLGSHDIFREELDILGKLNNSSVMTPLAYVLTVDSAYLFYEFAEKGTLFSVLHSGGSNLDWSSRYSIAIGVAQGLAFLHGCGPGPILLLDLSSKSILLKSLKEPQIGDIELCKVIDPSKSTGSLSAIAGSVGYIPPEYAYTMRVTMAGNVYSFGVILLELVTGKPAVSEGTELAKWALSKSAQKDKCYHILDYSVSQTSVAVRTQMLAVLRVALACVSVSVEARPKMKSVLRMLLNAR